MLPPVTYSTSPNCGTPTEYEINGGWGLRYWNAVQYLVQKYNVTEDVAIDHIAECERSL